jgi:hypothetical protein
MKRACFLSLALMLTGSAMAVPFDNSAGGPAVAVVNSAGGGDYTSLADAISAFNAVAGNINRPWTLQIASDLTETTNIFVGNTFGAGGSLTIKPAPATTPTIQFTDATTPAGIFGHFVFGVNSGALPDTPNYRPSDGNYIIDGSNTDGGTTRDLTIQVGTPATPIASTNNRLIRIFGETHGVIIRNCVLNIYDTAGTISAIALAGGQVPNGGTSVAPDRTQIINNLINSVSNSNNSFGIDSTMAANGTAATGTSFDDTVISGNTINAQQRGIFMNGFANTLVEANTVNLTGSLGTITHQGIFHFNSNGVSPFTVNINRNRVNIAVVLASGDYTAAQGGIGILCDSGSAGAVGAFNVTNNTVKLSLTGATTPTDILSRGISISSITSNYIIEHNSVEVAAGSANGSTASRLAAMSSVLGFSSGSAAIRNNIFVNRDLDGNSSGLFVGNTVNVSSADNVLVGRVPGRIGATDFANIGDWTTLSTIDTTSQSVDPATTSPAWDSDLLFPGTPAGVANVAASTTLVDVLGNARPATGALPGAQQPSSSASDWMQY